MTFARIENGVIAQYPYSESELRADNFGTSFPLDLTGVDLSDFGVVVVGPTAMPSTTIEQAIDEATPALVEGVWQQVWTVRARTADELTAAKLAKWELVKAKYQAVLAAGLPIAGLGTVQTDPASFDNIHQAMTGAIVAQMLSLPYTINFTLANNTSPTLNGAQMLSIGEACGNFKSHLHDHSQTLRSQIEATATFAALEAVDIEGGWPSG
jgi:hypothetical protein